MPVAGYGMSRMPPEVLSGGHEVPDSQRQDARSASPDKAGLQAVNTVLADHRALVLTAMLAGAMVAWLLFRVSDALFPARFDWLIMSLALISAGVAVLRTARMLSRHRYDGIVPCGRRRTGLVVESAVQAMIAGAVLYLYVPWMRLALTCVQAFWYPPAAPHTSSLFPGDWILLGPALGGIPLTALLVYALARIRRCRSGLRDLRTVSAYARDQQEKPPKENG